MSQHSVITPSLNRPGMVAWYRRNRQRSRHLFDLITPEAYYTRPIALRHPIVFYEGHLPAFSVNTLIKKGLGRSGIDRDLETLFARGIDPHDEQAAASKVIAHWPPREVVRQYADAADEIVIDALEHADLERPAQPVLDRAEGVYAILEHEAMHQETLLYMWHQLPYTDKRRPPESGEVPRVEFESVHRTRETIEIPAGRATLGASHDEILFGWDNEFDRLIVEVPEFEIDVHNVTNQDFLEFVDAGGYHDSTLWSRDNWRWRHTENIDHPLFWRRRGDQWMWRGMFEEFPLPASWPVYVSQAEADAYARWRGKRLPTEPEFHRAAFATPTGDEHSYPWGETPPDVVHGNFDFRSWDPAPIGSHPEGQSAWGVHDLVGNGWEWTSSIFGPFPGFQPMPSYPEYSADFFDGEHYVMKGASPATARELIRRSFRNWFRPQYPYVYATFRCVSHTT